MTGKDHINGNKRFTKNATAPETKFRSSETIIKLNSFIKQNNISKNSSNGSFFKIIKI